MSWSRSALSSKDTLPFISDNAESSPFTLKAALLSAALNLKDLKTASGFLTSAMPNDARASSIETSPLDKDTPALLKAAFIKENPASFLRLIGVVERLKSMVLACAAPASILNDSAALAPSMPTAALFTFMRVLPLPNSALKGMLSFSSLNGLGPRPLCERVNSLKSPFPSNPAIPCGV